MVWPDVTAGPLPGLRTSVASLVGAAPPGTVRDGFCPKAPVTLTPELAEEPDGAADEEEPPQAARAGAASNPAASTRAPRRDGRADSFTRRNLRLLGVRDSTTVRAEAGHSLAPSAL